MIVSFQNYSFFLAYLSFPYFCLAYSFINYLVFVAMPRKQEEKLWFY